MNEPKHMVIDINEQDFEFQRRVDLYYAAHPELRDEFLLLTASDGNIQTLTFGLPMDLFRNDGFLLNAPSEPYVMIGDTFTVKKNIADPGVVLRNVKILFCHGGSRDGKWILANGLQVQEVVDACWRSTSSQILLDAVMACAGESGFDQIALIDKAFNDFQDYGMIYADHDVILATTVYLDMNGKLIVNLWPKNKGGVIHGVDEVINRSIREQIEIV